MLSPHRRARGRLRTRALLLALVLPILSCDLRYSEWCDPATELCWQNPQRRPHDADDTGMVPSQAAAYCEALVLDGHDDWRLPTIDELRTLVDGSPATQPGGACGVTAGAGTGDGESPACLGRAPFAGPGPGGCYWRDGLRGTCDKPDPAVVGHPLETWALNLAADDPAHWVSYVTFDTGAAGFNHSCSLGDVRCVRSTDGAPPPACEVDGVPCADLLPSKQHCDQDLTGIADSIALTVRVPEALPGRPYQLLAFLYEADADWFPPLGPPDGGTDFDQVIAPDLDVDRPLEIVVPGTSYYREELLDGDYQLYVQVQMVEKFPPIPVPGDFVWGEGRASIHFPLSGTEHTRAVLEMEVTLEPIGCPSATPHLCPDGTCVADESECSPSECPADPDDTDVLTCRYESTFIAENCADFPIADGWTASAVGDFCAAQIGADPATVEVSLGTSCLVESGGFSTATRCAALDADRRWWAYGTPRFVCDLFIPDGSFEEGPFCSEY